MTGLSLRIGIFENKINMKKYISIISILLICNVAYGQQFSNISNIENLFNMSKTEVDSIIKDNNYKVKSKDVKTQTIVYQNVYYYSPYDSFVWTITATFKDNKLEHFMWNDMMSRAIFMSKTIQDGDYKILESKTDDELGVFYLQSSTQPLDIIIYRTLPNLDKKQFSFYIFRRPKS
jgi:hypothetical protein